MNKLVMKRRKTIVKIAVILVLLLAVLFPAKYSNSIYGYLPFLGLVFLILLSLMYLFIMRMGIHFEEEAFDIVCQRGEKVYITLKIVNKSILICPKARVYLYVSDFFGEEDNLLSTTFTMYGKSQSEFPMDIKMNHIGVYTAGVKVLQIYDMLGIFSIKIPGSKDFTVTVLPKTYLSQEVYLEDKLLTETQNAQKSTISDGFDYTGVREYSLGDSMKRIHWKLSAHSLGYMTKITETSKKSDMTVVIDFVAGSFGPKAFPSIYDCLIETALSFVEQASRKDVEYSLLFVGCDGEITRVITKGEQDYENLVHQISILYSDLDVEIPDGVGILEQERHSSNRSSNIILCTSRVTDQLIQELITIKQQQRNPMLYYILPPELMSHEIEALKAPIKVLGDYNIVYHLVLAETVS